MVSIASDDADENPYTFAIQGSATTPPTPEIELRGNGVSIANGNNPPNSVNGTEFGSTPAGGGMVQHTFTIHNTGDGALNLPGDAPITISGAQSGDFAVVTQPAAQVAAGEWVNFTIVFTPQATGLRQAVVSITSDDADENPYTFAIQGSATAVTMPVRLFLPLVLRSGH